LAAGSKARRYGSLPSPGELTAFIRESPGAVGEREIVRAFRLSPSDRGSLRAMLRDAEISGVVARGARRGLATGAGLPEVTVVERFGADEDGVPLARPIAWPGPEPAPVLRLVESGLPEALPLGGRAAARLVVRDSGEIEARVIRRLDAGGERVVGVFRHGQIVPTDRRDRNEYRIAPTDTAGAAEGELVVAERLAAARLGLPRARIVELSLIHI